MRPRLPWIAVAVAAAALVAGFALDPTNVNSFYLLPIAIPFVAVGALLALRRPENVIGWLFLGFGTVASIDYLAEQYSELARSAGSNLPGADLSTAFAAHFWHPFFSLFVFAFLLFPDGHLVSPRWRWFAYAVVVDYGLLVLSAPLDHSYIGPDYPRAHALFPGPASDVATIVYGVCLSLNLLLLPIAGASLIVRLRRSTGRRHEQVRLFAYTVAAVMLAFPVFLLATGSAYGVFLLPLIPISAGVAILRHRLFDIDVVINRALVYGALTVALGATYLASVLLVGLAVGRSGFAVAVSTLAVAALFRPARARIQGAVDKRFYRRRYDAARTLEAFGVHLRDELDLDALGADLRRVVAETVQPAHVSLWLRRTR
jgi:MFS family permease